MHNDFESIVKHRIGERHQGDERQLQVIYSPDKRILVEAPAGYGKTNTMVSKIAYLIATNQIPNPKKILALTFSVNAAYKIKKDVSQQVPLLLAETGLNVSVSNKIFVTNYHGFCRSVLKKYGSIFHSNLGKIDQLQSIDDSDVKRNQTTIGGLLYEEAYFMSEYCDALKVGNETFLAENLENYNDIIIKNFLPLGYISYNAILTLCIKLFRERTNILDFYKSYYSTLLVDEYQDTNTLSYWLVSLLVSDSGKVILLGDSLQRIYGFIGAVHGLLSISQNKFGLTKIQLTKNYRFASNPQMLQLDANIRLNAESPIKPVIKNDAEVVFGLYDTQSDEALEVVRKAIKLVTENRESKVAILVKQRGGNVDKIIGVFDHNNIPYFYGLFTDEDPSYISFHKKSLFEFIEIIKTQRRVTKKLSSEHLKRMTEIFKDEQTSTIKALQGLLNIFWARIFSEFSSLSHEEKIIFVLETFENNGLKQYIEFINKSIILTTVHAAKGLEWDFVIIPDLEQDSFPNWVGGLCNKGGCKFKNNCNLQIDSTNEKAFLEELSVFYVAVTRARKQVFFTASRKQYGGYSKNVSCFLKLPGLKITNL